MSRRLAGEPGPAVGPTSPDAPEVWAGRGEQEVLALMA